MSNKDKKSTKLSLRSTIVALLNGNIVASTFVRKQIPFILVLFIIALIYISNRYHAENVFRETEKISKEIEELRAEKIDIENSLMKTSRLIQIEELLKEKGSTLNKPKTPPKKIPLN
jgi:cell division protein FtsL